MYDFIFCAGVVYLNERGTSHVQVVKTWKVDDRMTHKGHIRNVKSSPIHPIFFINHITF